MENNSLPLGDCVDCGSIYPSMYNCDSNGERTSGFICVKCWKAKHPVMKPPKKKFNPALVIWGCFVFGFLLFAFYKIMVLSYG